MKRPFEAYSGSERFVFVSYARRDAALVYPELDALHRDGLRIWYDEGIEPGLTWRDEVASAIIDCSLFLLFISPRSVASPVCAQELNFALAHDRPVLAVHLEDTPLPPGMELSLGAKQAILRQDHAPEEFRARLARVVRGQLGEGPEAPEPATDGPLETPPSIAIMPFTDRGGSEQGHYLAEGIAEELIYGLSRVDGLRVVSGFSCRNAGLDVRSLGRRFKVGAVLDGSVQQAAGRLRIIVRLADTRDGSMVWSQRYDEAADDIFAVQDTVAAAVLDALHVNLATAGGETSLDLGTGDVDAYEAFLLGTYEMRKDRREGYERAVECLTRAAALDPAYARARYLLGVCLWELTVYRGREPALIEQAERAFEQARALGYEPEVPWVHVERRLHPELRPPQRELAREALERIRAGDNSWRGFEFAQLGRCLGSAGLYQAAFDFLGKAPAESAAASSRIDSVARDLESLLPVLGRFGEAIDALTRRLEDRPDDLDARRSRAMLYCRTRRSDLAQEELRALADAPAAAFLAFYDGWWRGSLADADEPVDRLLQDENLPPRYAFWACALAGRVDQAVESIEASADRGAPIFNLRVLLNSALPGKVARQVERHPGFVRLLSRFGIDADWPAELAGLANDLAPLTGVYVADDA